MFVVVKYNKTIEMVNLDNITEGSSVKNVS